MNRRLALAARSALALGLLATCATAPPQAAAELPCQIESVDRIVAVGDVHGSYDRFVEILRTSGILDQRLHWSGGHTHLVQTGDVVDRGPDSRKVLDLLEQLQREARRAGGAVHPLLGNHEVMRILGDERYVSPGEYAAFVTAESRRVRDEFLRSASRRDDEVKDVPLGYVEMRLALGRDGKYGEWFRTLNTVVKINGILFVHGGLSPATAGMSCDEINRTIRREITTDLDKTRAAPLTSLAARDDGPLWYRGLALEPDTFAPTVDDILSKQKASTIVIGHTVVEGGRIRVRFGGKVIQIDTGMQPAYVPTGRASALEIRNGVFTAIYADQHEPLSGAPARPVPATPASR
jgi:hypothetical protein